LNWRRLFGGENVYIDPLTRAEIAALPDLQDVFQQLKQLGLEDICWEVFGSSQAEFKKLKDSFQRVPQNMIRETTIGILLETIADASRMVRSCICRNQSMVTIIERMRSNGNILNLSEAQELGLPLDIAEEIFQFVHEDACEKVIPLTQAIGIVIKFNVKKKISFDELLEMLV